MHIRIVTPARSGSRHGNRNTAERWATHLRSLDHQVDIAISWTGQECDVLIALHARRSHASIKAWKSACPTRPLLLVLTGTDLYRDIHLNEDARESLALADHMVVLQREGLSELSSALRHKTSVIYQSIRAVKRQIPPRSYCLITVIGHLREEKDPFCAAQALAQLPKDMPIRVVHLGKAMSPAFKKEARIQMRTEPRYEWLGECDHATAMRWLSRSHAMVISSHMEGGAHVVSEAIAIGVPVIASKISGNIGLLGKGFPAYYPVGNHAALSLLLARLAHDVQWREKLASAVRSRQDLIDPELELHSLSRVLAKITRHHSRSQ